MIKAVRVKVYIMPTLYFIFGSRKLIFVTLICVTYSHETRYVHITYSFIRVSFVIYSICLKMKFMAKLHKNLWALEKLQTFLLCVSSYVWTTFTYNMLIL